MGTETARCQWHDSAPCQFSEDQKFGLLHEWNGRRYCALHLPIEAGEEKSILGAHDTLLFIRETRDLRGVQFPPGSYTLSRWDTDLMGCVFAEGVELRLGGGTYDFSGSRFGAQKQPSRGKVHIGYAGDASVRLDAATVLAALEIAHGKSDSARSWSMKEAVFHAELRIPKVRFVHSLDLSGATFFAPIRFDEKTTMPQQTRAQGCKFKRGALTPDAEGSYRAARLVFGQHKNREIEGLFYANEKRCHRYGLGWHWKNWIPRAFSALYDYTSRYGHSYELTFGWLLLAQAAFAFLYSLALERFTFGAPLDSDVIMFTLAQAFKPFDLLSARSHGTTFNLVSPGEVSAELGAVAIAHGVVSLSLFALFLLAIRWRFRRD